MAVVTTIRLVLYNRNAHGDKDEDRLGVYLVMPEKGTLNAYAFMQSRVSTGLSRYPDRLFSIFRFSTFPRGLFSKWIDFHILRTNGSKAHGKFSRTMLK